MVDCAMGERLEFAMTGRGCMYSSRPVVQTPTPVVSTASHNYKHNCCIPRPLPASGEGQYWCLRMLLDCKPEGYSWWAASCKLGWPRWNISPLPPPDVGDKEATWIATGQRSGGCTWTVSTREAALVVVGVEQGIGSGGSDSRS